MSSDPPARMLDWDSQHWAVAIARVRDGDFTPTLATDLARWSETSGARLLSYLCDARDGASLVCAQTAGFTVVDVRLEFANDVASPSSTPSDTNAETVKIRAADPSDLERLRDIASVVHTGTRFTVDPKLQPRAAALYERWIERDLFAGGLALAAVARDEVVGYLTGHREDKTGTISLVGVDAAARGCGAGRGLVRAALDWFRAEGCVTVDVVTSASARAAQRLYQAMGFRASAAGVWLHRWNDETTTERP